MLNFLPMNRRVMTVLETFVREADQARGETLHTLTETDGAYVVVFNDCLYCHSLHTSEPICLTVVGTLEATLTWGTGRDYAVSETTRTARGDEVCTLVIDKRPLHVQIDLTRSRRVDGGLRVARPLDRLVDAGRHCRAR